MYKLEHLTLNKLSWQDYSQQLTISVVSKFSKKDLDLGSCVLEIVVMLYHLPQILLQALYYDEDSTDCYCFQIN
jgi:hypothetical protein